MVNKKYFSEVENLRNWVHMPSCHALDGTNRVHEIFHCAKEKGCWLGACVRQKTENSIFPYYRFFPYYKIACAFRFSGF
jgi:hypothetical protein